MATITSITRLPWLLARATTGTRTSPEISHRCPNRVTLVRLSRCHPATGNMLSTTSRILEHLITSRGLVQTSHSMGNKTLGMVHLAGSKALEAVSLAGNRDLGTAPLKVSRALAVSKVMGTAHLIVSRGLGTVSLAGSRATVSPVGLRINRVSVVSSLTM